MAVVKEELMHKIYCLMHQNAVTVKEHVWMIEYYCYCLT